MKKCPNCKKENKLESKFCRFCGDSLDFEPNKTEKGTQFSISAEGIKELVEDKLSFLFKKKIVKRVGFFLLLALVVVLIWGFIGHFRINDNLEEARSANNSGNFEKAMASLNEAENIWALFSSNGDLNKLKKKTNSLIKQQSLLEKAITKKEEGSFNEALLALEKIDPSFPDYNKVKKEIFAIHDKIVENLNSKIEQKEQRAQTLASQKQQAQARARQAQQEAEQAQQQVEKEQLSSYLDEVESIYGSIINGSDYWNRAFDYIGEGDYSSFSVVLSQADSVIADALQRSRSLLENRTPTSYLEVSRNLKCAAENYDAAFTALINAVDSYQNGYTSSGDQYYNNSSAYEDQAVTCINEVYDFLNRMGR